MNRSGSDINSRSFDELNSFDDNELVEISRSGADPVRGRQAVSVLISRYLPLVRKKACGHACDYAEPEDLAQEGFLSFLKAVNSFDVSRGAKFSSFADVCITNGIRSAVTKLGRNAGESSAENIRENVPDDSSPENIWFEKEAMFDIYSEISSFLSKKEWSIFRLYLGGLSYREIAERLGVPQKSVDNAVFRVRKKLKAFFSQGKQSV